MLASWACVVDGWEVVTPRKLKFDECWMVDWYLRWVDDRICAESFVRVDDRICDECRVGGGDPLEI